MGARNTPEQQRAYNQARRDRKKQQGRVRVELWPHREDAGRVRAYALELDKLREATGK